MKKPTMPAPTTVIAVVAIALAVALYARFPGYQRYQLLSGPGGGYYMMRLDTVTGDVDVCEHRPSAGDLNAPSFKMVCYHH